jgi:sugar (pentulose or hexulose) kinase
MSIRDHLFIGIDIGTQGLRVAAMDSKGNLAASCKEHFIWTDNREEQDPDIWWSVLLDALRNLSHKLKETGSLPRIKAISVTSTSGTVIPLDGNGNPLHAALMYSDKRSHQEAELCSEASGLPLNSSFGLPKMVWFTKQFPDKSLRIRSWCHAADYIIGKLSGIWGITDYTNALKSGYDLEREQWPDYIGSKLQLPLSWFPQVVPPGSVIGTLSTSVCELTGLPSSIRVVAGMTDGCSSQIASGCVKLGDWNTTIGTTLVIKGVTRKPIRDPLGRVYNHKHPQGYWMPGGASNTGADWISRDYRQYDLQLLNLEAAAWTPTPWLCYPLLQEGERFPFVAPAARGFDASGLTPVQTFAARLEGVAYIERLAYECLEDLSGEEAGRIYSAGGGSLSDLWLNIRSSVLQKPIYKMKHVEGSAGAAMVAASQTEFRTLEEAVRSMVQIDKFIEPGPYQEVYSESFGSFKALLTDKGYLCNAI